MIWLLTVPLIILLILIYLLFAPFYLEINSRKERCLVRFHKIASARLLILDSSLILEVRVAGWKRNFDLLDERKPRRKMGVTEKVKKRKRKISFGKILQIVKSFKVIRLTLAVDTGNMETNGILFPVFYWISRLTGKNFTINFIGSNEIELNIKNNLARIIWAYIR